MRSGLFVGWFILKFVKSSRVRCKALLVFYFTLKQFPPVTVLNEFQ